MHHGQTTGNQNPSQGEHETYEIEMKSKPRRALGGKGLLSHPISVQGLKNSHSKSYPREKREEEQREGEEAHRGEGALGARKGEPQRREWVRDI